jgi:hypothetical protein
MPRHPFLALVVFALLVHSAAVGGTGEIWFDAPGSLTVKKGESNEHVNFSNLSLLEMAVRVRWIVAASRANGSF